MGRILVSAGHEATTTYNAGLDFFFCEMMTNVSFLMRKNIIWALKTRP